MNSKDCLSEQELTLNYYDELDADRQRHFDDCQRCTDRLAALTAQLDQLPKPDCTPDPLAGVRMAARVREQLTTRRRRQWLPVLGAGAVAAIALVLTFSPAPPPEMQQVTLSSPEAATLTGLEEDMPDIEFLDDIELLKELDLLVQIEGV
ncbi:MAG: hypothetical protein PVF84_05160 [Desulfuromonadales bacterium]|jgi:hypothetical protein